MEEGAVWSLSGCALFLLCFQCSNMILPWSCITLCHYDHKVAFHTAVLWNSVKTNMQFRVFQKTTLANTQCGDYKDRSTDSLICSLILCLHCSFHYDPRLSLCLLSIIHSGGASCHVLESTLKSPMWQATEASCEVSIHTNYVCEHVGELED